MNSLGPCLPSSTAISSPPSPIHKLVFANRKRKMGAMPAEYEVMPNRSSKRERLYENRSLLAAALQVKMKSLLREVVLTHFDLLSAEVYFDRVVEEVAVLWKHRLVPESIARRFVSSTQRHLVEKLRKHCTLENKMPIHLDGTPGERWQNACRRIRDEENTYLKTALSKTTQEQKYRQQGYCKANSASLEDISDLSEAIKLHTSEGRKLWLAGDIEAALPHLTSSDSLTRRLHSRLQRVHVDQALYNLTYTESTLGKTAESEESSASSSESNENKQVTRKRKKLLKKCVCFDVQEPKVVIIDEADEMYDRTSLDVDPPSPLEILMCRIARVLPTPKEWLRDD